MRWSSASTWCSSSPSWSASASSPSTPPPNHPQTCGKVERFHQTLKRFLARQPPLRSLAELQLQLDTADDGSLLRR
jgi:hypothetical protein